MTIILLAIAAQLLACWACYRWGYDSATDTVGPLEFRRGLNVGRAGTPYPERTDGALLRATPAEIDACFGPRGVVRP